MDVGDALRSRIQEALSTTVGKYFGRGGGAEVRLHKDGFNICCDMVVTLAAGQMLVVKGQGADAHAAFDAALAKLDKRTRRYKRLLTNHHSGGRAAPVESAPLTVLRSGGGEDGAGEDDDPSAEWGDDGSAGSGPPAAMIVAETTAPLRTLTVAMAVMELDLTEAPVLIFRNAAHGGLSVIYRRTDGNIGWVDPERTRTAGVGQPAAPAGRAPTVSDAGARIGTKV